MHKTSLNVSRNLNARLNEVSEKFNISKRMLVRKIFMYCHAHLDFSLLVTGELIAYQRKVPGDKWKCLRVDFSDTECDVYFEYKKMFRISLSKLLAVGFVLFFDLIIAELSGASEDKISDAEWILNTYTETKQILYAFVEDTFKYFNLKPKKET